MPAICNACGSAIDADDINVQADTAFCRQCGTASPYSAIVHAPVASMFTAPPAGCHVETDGHRWRAVASTRSWKAIPVCCFALFWNCFLAVFATLIIAGGAWPALIVMVFHIAAGVFLAWTALRLAGGQIELSLDDNTLTIAEVVGPIRRTRRVDRLSIRGVRQESGVRSPIGAARVIVLDAIRPVKFGAFLTDERRQFLHAVLATELMHRRQPLPAAVARAY